MAESAASVVVQRYGIDTGDYSFPYVASWARDRSVLTRNLNAIQCVVRSIIDGIQDDEGRDASDQSSTTRPERG